MFQQNFRRISISDNIRIVSQTNLFRKCFLSVFFTNRHKQIAERWIKIQRKGREKQGRTSSSVLSTPTRVRNTRHVYKQSKHGCFKQRSRLLMRIASHYSCRTFSSRHGTPAHQQQKVIGRPLFSCRKETASGLNKMDFGHPLLPARHWYRVMASMQNKSCLEVLLKRTCT